MITKVISFLIIKTARHIQMEAPCDESKQKTQNGTARRDNPAMENKVRFPGSNVFRKRVEIDQIREQCCFVAIADRSCACN